MSESHLINYFKIKTILLSFVVLTGVCGRIFAEEMVVRVDKPGAYIQPTMYGLFFEDINYAADGGLYAEMIKNRSFDFPQALMGLSTVIRTTYA